MASQPLAKAAVDKVYDVITDITKSRWVYAQRNERKQRMGENFEKV